MKNTQFSSKFDLKLLIISNKVALKKEILKRDLGSHWRVSIVMTWTFTLHCMKDTHILTLIEIEKQFVKASMSKKMKKGHFGFLLSPST
jgi:hypothetical protein